MASLLSVMLPADVCARALGARDARFDGLFFVGITTTGIYCRPVCPSRVSTPARRRFFESAASAERAGFRPCLRCRPELAPGRALIDAVPRLARLAAHRIGAGALNGRGVRELARELGVSERHLRRVLEREIGVSPIELAQTHRLLLAKQLLADTSLSITRIAYASGFQSLRRFNFTFRERYRMSPSALRRARRTNGAASESKSAAPVDLVRLTLAYRAPFAWGALIAQLQREALPGVEVVDCACYRRTVRIDGRDGVVFVSDAASNAPESPHGARNHLNVDVTPSLLPVLMPLLARLRALFDLDAEPAAIDAHLAQGGLTALVRERPGLRVPGTLEGFDVVLRSLIGSAVRSRAQANHLVRRVVETLADPMDGGFSGLDRLAPTAEHVAAAGAARLSMLGVPKRRAESLATLAGAIADRQLRLEPGGDVEEARRGLMHIADLSERVATTIVMRSMCWPDALPVTDRALQRTAGVANPGALRALAERWRPWRAYAAQHLWLGHTGGLA